MTGVIEKKENRLQADSGRCGSDVKDSIAHNRLALGPNRKRGNQPARAILKGST